tara:strand:- start:1176 stop:1787 length:612 start_codon:yes stop_codon:yes gene_type:complete
VPSYAYYNVSTEDVTTLVSANSSVASVASDYANNPDGIQEYLESPKSITICNSDASGDDITVELYIASAVSTNITDTGVNVNEIANYITSSSVTLTVDGTGATEPVFINEKVYKSDGTLIGTCTDVPSGTSIVFGGGIEADVLDNTDLYTGTQYHILHDVVIPGGSTLVLDEAELAYNSNDYHLKFKLSTVSGGQIACIKVVH